MATQQQQAQNEYGVYHVPEGLEGRPAAKAVLAGKPYEPDTLSFMRAHAGIGDIIHAGAFFGDFIPALSSALAPDARLWAFEPNPGNFAAAQKTVEMNALENVTLTNAALSDRDESVLFQTRDKTGKSLGGVSHFVQKDGPGVETVKAMMLDYAVPLDRPVSILQLDVEGHEKQALLGAFHIINRWQPILIVEYFDKPTWIARNFRQVPYERVGKVHGNSIFAPKSMGLTLKN